MDCRLCGSEKLSSIIPLGMQPLANRLLKTEALSQTEPQYNLEVLLCEMCGLAQLKDLVPPEELFSLYHYYSSNSETMLESAKNLTHKMMEKLEPDSFIVEIASNDGYLLKNYVENKIRVLGIEPAQNIAEFATATGIPTLCEFFSAELAMSLVKDYPKADMIHANNVMAHVPDIHSFVKGLSVLLAAKGTITIEVHYFLDLVQKLEFDTIYHEHVYYFAIKPLQAIFKEYGLEIYDIEKLAIHGGSLLLFI